MAIPLSDLVLPIRLARTGLGKQDLERAYRFVLDDPQFRVGTRPDGPLSINAKRFIVEMYEKLIGKRLLQ